MSAAATQILRRQPTWASTASPIDISARRIQQHQLRYSTFRARVRPLYVRKVFKMSLPNTYPRPVTVAIIGGTGISHLEHFTPTASLTVPTPWGNPSSPIIILETDAGAPVAFIARHGVHHQYTPTEVPSRANIAALRSIGVRTIIAFSAVGSLREEIPPRDFVVPSQIIDRTKGNRPSTFFEGGVVAHVGFSDPFDAKIGKIVKRCEGALSGGAKIHEDKTLIDKRIEGPQFSTRAESKLYRAWGGDIINMSAVPESKLAREAEIHYAMICMATDYDCFRDDAPPVNVTEVMGHMKANALNAQHLVGHLLEELVKEEHDDLHTGVALKESAKYAICTSPAGMSKEVKERLRFLFPDYFPADDS
ncbi:S-methyl-5'-thioadenosine phosphorylase [Drechslerella dactyloides]|uniref:S-methyl-5'-thioadenosine phosphorylase n=1 Tax=Drechslerella dactyloides TaxID=74499 RepID=A0AAD6NKA5_DREDA|nr:S-methyl-5'-thioadenosine phosphorylase [Drechslerella dactyloides]